MHEAPSLAALQDRLGYQFSDLSLLERALVHRSWAHDHNPPIPDNERLEFLGDAVLGLVVAERLFDDSRADEGRLTRARADLVRRENLATQARRLKLGRWLLLGRGEDSSGGRDKDSILADAFEAVVGAIYRDGAFEAARTFIERSMERELLRKGDDGGLHSPRDARTRLQESLQRSGRGTPRYRLLGSDGPPHDPVWTMEVHVNGSTLGRGTGSNKQAAARAAAREAIEGLSEFLEGPQQIDADGSPGEPTPKAAEP